MIDITYWLEHNDLDTDDFISQLFSAALLMGSEVIQTTGDPDYVFHVSTLDDEGRKVVMYVKYEDEVFEDD